MQAFTILFSVLAISISSMDLALAIVWGRRAEYRWSKFLIVFMATVLGLVFSYALVSFSPLLLTGTASLVFSIVWEAIYICDVAFLFVFIPIFINWVIARPFQTREKLVSIVLASAFVASAIVSMVTRSDLAEKMKFVCFLPVIVYTVVVMAQARMDIAEKDSRAAALTIEIVSISMIPFLVVPLFAVSFSSLALPIVAFCYFVMVLVFLFIAINKQLNEEKDVEIDREDVRRSIVEKYHITDREMEVIELIKQGLTNKEIASELNISVNTVNNHISNAFTKTGVRCRIDLLNLLKEASW